MVRPVGEASYLLGNVEKFCPTVCAKFLKVIQAVGRCFCFCFFQKEQVYGIVLDEGEVVMDSDGTMVLNGKQVSLADSDEQKSTHRNDSLAKDKRWKDIHPSSKTKKSADKKIFKKASMGEVVQGTKFLNSLGNESSENSVAPLVVLQAIKLFGSMLIKGEISIKPEVLNEVFCNGLACFEKESERPQDFMARLQGDQSLQAVSLIDVYKNFTMPKSPTPYKQTVSEDDSDVDQKSEDSGNNERPLAQNQYLVELENLLAGLQATMNTNGYPLLGTVFFIGEIQNPKAYGIFLHKHRSKIYFYFFNPYAHNGISLHKFPGPSMLRNYMAVVEPAHLKEVDKNMYWVCPLILKP